MSTGIVGEKTDKNKYLEWGGGGCLAFIYHKYARLNQQENQNIFLKQFVCNGEPSPSRTQSILLHEILCFILLLTLIH